jgi:hypothetical protein
MKHFLTLSLICAVLASCGGPAAGPEQALRAWVDEAEAAAEERDRGSLLDLISKDYADGRGNDHESIGQMLRLYFLRQQSVALLTTIDEIILSDDTAALLRLTVGMAGTNSSVLGISADAYNFELELQVDDAQWLLIGARWSELGEKLH